MKIMCYNCQICLTAPECPLGMVYQQYGSMCPQTCETDENTVCTEGCAEGCFCPSGKVLNNDGNCIDPAECPGMYVSAFANYLL